MEQLENMKLTGKYEFKIIRLNRWYERALFKTMKVLCKPFNSGLHIDFLQKYGVLKEAWCVDNLVVSAGKAQIALLAYDSTATPFTYLALGTSNTAPSVGQTALIAELSTLGFSRSVADTLSRVTTTVTNDTTQLVKTWTASGSATLEEIGVFNASSVGTMYSRALTTSRILVSGDTFLATYKMIFA